MVVAWTGIICSSSSLARAGILLSCLVKMVGEVVVGMLVEMLVEIGEGGMKFFTRCRLPIGFHQVPGNLQHQDSVLSLISAGSCYHAKDTRQGRFELAMNPCPPQALLSWSMARADSLVTTTFIEQASA